MTTTLIFIARGSSAGGDNDDSYVRIIVWAREAVRGAKVTSSYTITLKGSSQEISHFFYLDGFPKS